jgi:hypothetical protein
MDVTSVLGETCAAKKGRPPMYGVARSNLGPGHRRSSASAVGDLVGLGFEVIP